MGKTLQQHGKHQLYIREKYKPIWEEFLKLIKKDKEFKRQSVERGVGNPGLISIAIMNFVYNYVLEKNPDFKLYIEDETPN